MSASPLTRQPLHLLFAPGDETFAQRLALQLRQVGYEVTTATTGTADATSPSVLVVLSPTALQSPQFTAAWQAAFAQRRQIVPIVAQACAIPPELGLFQWIIFAGREAEGFLDLQRALAATSGKRVLPLPRRTLIAWLALGAVVLAVIIGGSLAIVLAQAPHQIVNASVPTPTPLIHGRTQTFILPPPILSLNILVAAPDGTIWGNTLHELVHLDPHTGHFTVVNPVAQRIDGLVIAPDGTVWYLDDGDGSNPGTIGHILPNGAIKTYAIQEGMTSLQRTPDGSLWFSSFDTLGRLTPDGVIHYISLPEGRAKPPASSRGDVSALARRRPP